MELGGRAQDSSFSHGQQLVGFDLRFLFKQRAPIGLGSSRGRADVRCGVSPSPLPGGGVPLGAPPAAPKVEDEVGRAFKLERRRSVVQHELFQEAMGAMSRLGEELAGVDSRLEAEGLRLVEERRKLRVAINLGHYQRDLENAKAEASLKIAHEARSRALEEAREADRRREAAEKRKWELQA